MKNNKTTINLLRLQVLFACIAVAAAYVLL